MQPTADASQNDQVGTPECARGTAALSQTVVDAAIHPIETVTKVLVWIFLRDLGKHFPMGG